MTYVQIMQIMQDMRISSNHPWALDNLRLPEVHLLHGEAVAADRQAAYTDECADFGPPACGAGRSGRVRTRRVRHYGTGWPEGTGDGAAGSHKEKTK